jgi:hypothetical protein
MEYAWLHQKLVFPTKSQEENGSVKIVPHLLCVRLHTGKRSLQRDCWKPESLHHQNAKRIYQENQKVNHGQEDRT